MASGYYKGYVIAKDVLTGVYGVYYDNWRKGDGYKTEEEAREFIDSLVCSAKMGGNKE